MPRFNVTSPEGQRFVINAPDGATPEQVLAYAKQQFATRPISDVPDPNNLVPARRSRPEPSFTDRAIGAGEAALSTLTGATSGTAGAVGGFLGGLAGAIRTGEYGTDEGARRVQAVTEQSASGLTYAPRTETGQRYAQAVGDALAATTPVLPMAVEIGAAAGNAGRILPVVRAPVFAATRRGASAVTDAAREAVSPARDRLERARVSARSEPSIDNPQVRVAPELAALQRAEKYATERLGIDLHDLPASISNQIAAVARNATALDRLDPAAIKRQIELQSLPVPVPATRGQLTRNLGQLKREESIRATEEGAPLMDIMSQQDAALGANLAQLRGSASGVTRQQLGTTIQDAARKKLAALERERDRLYEVARESGAMAAPVNVALLDEWLQVKANRRNAGWLDKALSDYRDGPNAAVTINDLESIRQEATAAAREGGREGHYAGQAVGVIDDILDNAANASEQGSPFRAARAAHKALKNEFEQQSLVNKLTSTKPNTTDRAVAVEDTVDHILRSSSEQIAGLRRTLLTAPSKELHEQGLDAWRHVRAGVIDRLRDEARNSSGEGIANQIGQPQFNGGKFLRRFDELDADGVLDEMFNAKELKQLRTLRNAVETTRTTPSGRFTGSDTVPKMLAMMDRFVSHVPVVGSTLRGAVSVAVKMHEKGMEAKARDAAVTSPLEEAARAKPPKARIRLRDIVNQGDRP